MGALNKEYTDQDLVQYIIACRDEAEEARSDREAFNDANFDAYHMKHDFTHKVEGQSVERFAKPRMAVEQTKSFFQQSLADMSDEWFSIELKQHNISPEAMLIKPDEAKKLLAHFLKEASYYRHVGACIQRGLNEAVMTSKISGKMVSQPKFETKGRKGAKKVVKVEDKTWCLSFTRVRAKNWYPDPTGNNLYCIEDMFTDLHLVKQQAKEGKYNSEVVNELQPWHTADTVDQQEKQRETGQNTNTATHHRPQVKITEFWGDLVSCEGDLLEENVVVTIANDKHVIRKATPNPMWHQKKPYICTPLIEVDGSVWHIALMDAPVQHNKTYTELFNLMLDAAFKQVHSPSQIRIQDLANQEQVADGIKPGTKLTVKSSLPVGGKVMEPLEEVEIPTDAMNMLNMIQQEFNAAALTNDLRQGVLPSRSVKATEVVEASQTITSVFQGMTKNVESGHIVPELEMSWVEIAQNWDKISKETFISLFGEDRGMELHDIDPQDIFVQTVNGFKYNVFGLTQTLAKAQDFQKITTALQTIAASPILQEPFLAEFDPKKIVAELMKALSIDVSRIQLSDKEREMNSAPAQPQGGMALPGMAPQQGSAPVQQAPSPLDQIFGAGMASSGFQGSF